MMRCGKLKTGSLFSRRLKFWFYGGVSLILADFGISMAHAQGRGSHGVAMQQQDGALVPDLDNFDHLPRTSYRTAIAMLLGLRRDADAAKLADENMMVGKGHLTGREHDVLSGLFAGSSNKEIARSLNLSEVTIKHHLKSLRSKLGAKNRTHAVCRAIELGIS
jgi:ATP/maltotriose-dependent transcriptional regulator MalT